MHTLTLFGTAALVGPGGPVAGRAPQGRRLALLAYLALARGRPVGRERLVALLWPDSAPERARHQLSDDLYIIRSALGDEVVRTVGDDLVLNTDLIVSDVATFERLLDQGCPEAAVALAAGPLLDGFHLAGGVEFEHWLDGERARLARRHASALEALAEASEARDDGAAAVGWWQRLAALDPCSGRVALRLMRALAAAGDRAGALRHARVHASLLQGEFGTGPDPDVEAYAERLRREPVGTRASEPVPDRAPVDAPAADAARAAASAPRAPIAGPPASAPASAPAASRAPGFRLAALAACAVVLVLVMVGLRGIAGARGPARAATASVGVLPFVNMGPDPADAYFGDGLAEQVIAALGRVEGLHVAARTSSFALRDGRLDVRTIGDTLGVAAVLEGSVRRDAGRVRITAQLVDAATGYRIWSTEFDREPRNVLGVQEEIAAAIARALERRLAPSGASARPHVEPDFDAYALYLRGLHLRDRLTPDGLREASALFDQVIERQPQFAAAYAAKASVVGPLIMFGHVPQSEGVPMLRALTTRALALDPDLGDAHAALGMLRLFFEWDWPGAERALRRAIALNPSDAHAHHHMANLHRALGRLDEAIASRARAVALDPLNPRTVVVLGVDHFVAGDMERAMAHFRRAQRLDPAHALALGSGPFLPVGPAEVHERRRRDADAVAEYVRIATLRGATARDVDDLRGGYARGGMPGFWARWLAMERRQTTAAPDPMRMANLSVRIGDTTQAVEWLERAYAARHPALVYLQHTPAFVPLHAHPRVAPILAGMRFPPR